MLKPQDIVVLLKVHSLHSDEWTYSTLASSIGMSASEVHAALKRCSFSRLYDAENVPYLLASKIEAFIGRGQRSFYFSADIEDIVALLDGCDRLEVEVQQADAEVRKFLSAWFRSEREVIWEVIPAFLSPAARNAGRGRLVRERIERLIHLA